LFEGLAGSWRAALSDNLVFLKCAAFLLLIIALARPQAVERGATIKTEGIDIVLAIDCSTSMLAEDFVLEGRRKNRLAAVKDVVRSFIEGRRNDRIGIVAFAKKAYTVSPLTLDYNWLGKNLERVEIGLIEDGTAIGSGLMVSLNRLKDSGAKSKVVVLLTDGMNNAGEVSPLTAANAAEAIGVKVYTIGAGTTGMAPFPVTDRFGRTVYRPVKIDIDEEVLGEIASKTNGLYFRATDTESLKRIYAEINELEKTPVEEIGYTRYQELFMIFLWPAAGLILVFILLDNTLARRLP
jgi:Ca-activated chloride channel family protein